MERSAITPWIQDQENTHPLRKKHWHVTLCSAVAASHQHDWHFIGVSLLALCDSLCSHWELHPLHTCIAEWGERFGRNADFLCSPAHWICTRPPTIDTPHCINQWLCAMSLTIIKYIFHAERSVFSLSYNMFRYSGGCMFVLSQHYKKRGSSKSIVRLKTS